MLYENEYNDLKQWVESIDEKILFCSGAIGDFFLGMDLALKNKMPLIYWSKPNTFEISKKFLSALKIKNFVINVGLEIWRNKNTHQFCLAIHDLLKDKGFRTHGNNKCNLPLVTFYPDIVNKEYYEFTNYKLNLPEKFCLICPSGNNNSHKIKRFFYLPEFKNLVQVILAKKIEPIIVGNNNQLQRYDSKKKYKWLQFDNFNGENIEPEHFIETVRLSKFTVSPDTSLKTLSAAMHVTTFVLRNRNLQNQFVNGAWDRIFLDKNKWKTIQCFNYNNLIKKISEFDIIKML